MLHRRPEKPLIDEVTNPVPLGVHLSPQIYFMSDYRRSLLYCVLFCLAIAALAAYDLRSSYLQEEENARDRVANSSFLIGEWVKGAFVASDYVLRDIISQVALSALRYPDPDPVRQARVTAFITAKSKSLSNHIVGVGLADNHCITTHTYNVPPRPSPIGFDANHREWCQLPRTDPQRETFVSNMFLGNTGHMEVVQSRRFRDLPDFGGVAGFAVELGFFAKWLDQMSIGQYGIIAITDTQLSLLARKPTLPEMLGKTVNDPLVEAFIASSERYRTFRSQSPLDGEGRLYGVRKVDDLPFVIVVGEADRDWLAGWRQRVWGMGITLLLLWGMAVVTLREHWALLRQREKFSQLANTDALTGVSNRRSFISQAERELKRGQRFGSYLAVLVLDIDRFKLINDTHGHAVGDRAIVGFSKACLKVLRETDLLGRLGGDEFVILLPDTNTENARVAAERIREAIEKNEVLDDEDIPLSMTSSIGVVMIGSAAIGIDDALARADAALYLAKQKGRNRVEFAD